VAVPAFANTAEAVDMVLAGLRYLAAADPVALAAEAQAECLRSLEQADAIATAAPTAPKSCTATARPPTPGNAHHHRSRMPSRSWPESSPSESFRPS